MKIQEWYTGEPSSLEYGKAIDQGRKKLKDKYYPFDVDLWYGNKSSLNSNGWNIGLEFGRGDFYQWIAQQPSTTFGSKELTLYGPMDSDKGEYVETVFDLAEYKDKEVSKFKSIEQVMNYLFTNFSHLRDDLDESVDMKILKESSSYCWYAKYFDMKGNKKFVYLPKDITQDAEEAEDMMQEMIREPFTKFVFIGSGYIDTVVDELNATLLESTWSPVEYDEETGEYFSRPGNEFDGIDPQTQNNDEELNEGLQYLENINSRKGIKAPKALTETYHIDDEEVMNKVMELGKELESQGFKYVNSKDSRDYYDFYRKIEDGKGIWKAVIYNYGAAEIIDVTYEQARGIEPIDSLEQLRKDLGKMLLPNNLEESKTEKEDVSEEKESAKLIEEVEVPTLEGPEEGAEYGLSELLNTAIQHELETVNEYNVLALNARAEGYDDIASVIDEINTEENKHIGQLQELLKTISPNAQAIVAGEAEASDDLVNIEESFDKIPVITFKGKRTFDTEEEAREFKKSLGDKYRAIHKVEYPDMTFYIVDFEED